MRPRAAAFVLGQSFVGATRRGEGRAARGAVPGALAGGPGRGYAPWSLQEFAGSTWRPTRAARAVLGLQRASGRVAPEEEKRRIANRAARAASVLRGRSWRAAGRA